MRILHTADWHIGQLFHDYDRTYEHSQFLDWLVEVLVKEKIDVLLVSGDVFDLSNPSAVAIRLFYTFLNKAVKSNADLQIVITAGNHDSASRLEAPKPLLESSNIHIVGTIERDEEGNFDYNKLIIPLKDRNNAVKAWCLAVPFLRQGDYPPVAECRNPYAEGVAALYREAYEHVLPRLEKGQVVIAMGHMHAQSAEVSEMDKAERLILGGLECISAGAFPEAIQYVALGHIHKAQRVGGKEHIRYCGSPIPMSFSEINYRHQVLVFDLDEKGVSGLTPIEVPTFIELLKVPAVHSNLTEVITSLQALPAREEDLSLAPYLQVRVLLEGPEPALRHKIEKAIEGKYVRLAKIDVRHPNEVSGENGSSVAMAERIHEIKPADMFSKLYQSRYQNEVPENLMRMFHEVAQEVAQSE